MDNTINGRTPEEIKKGLESCNMHQCPLLKCPYFNDEYCGETLNADALAYIQQLERERDAAIKDIVRTCQKCKHRENRFLKDGQLDDLCGTCIYNNMCNWQWRGVQEVE